MTKKYDDFIAELDALCMKHEIHISTSLYDNICIRDLSEHEQTLDFDCVEDLTKGSHDYEDYINRLRGHH